tara:strand:- start:616 stop:1761 length:1146 start_codon:yes stop_codon:yes gene_type:complete
MFNKISVSKMLGGLEGHIGDDDYSEPLNILIDSANKNNSFNLFGAFAFKNQLKDRLKMRSKLHNFLQAPGSEKLLPSPADPIFVTGLPRSGTTFLFNLLALDKNHRSPKYWEIMSPLPLTKSNFDIKKREWKINAELKFARTIIPKLRAMHHIRAQTPEECMLIATMNIRSIVYMCMVDVPEYVEYLKNCSFESVFLWHKRFFQMLELTGRPNRWLLKDPSHIGHIPEILSTYPNARFINIHRDPIQSIASFCSLTKNIRSAFSQNVDNTKIGKTVLDFWQHNLNKGMSYRGLLGPNQIVDINYTDFIQSPLDTIKNVYSVLGFDIDIQTENEMEEYLIKQNQIKKEKHNYSLEEFDLSPEIVKDHFHNYMMRHGFSDKIA